MDAPRFDRLTRRLAGHRLSRRAALRAGAGGLAAAALVSARGGAAQGTPPAGGAIAADNATLFVQTAAGGTFVPNPQAGTAATPGGAAGTSTAAQH
jgi:hypothetical protein